MEHLGKSSSDSTISFSAAASSFVDEYFSEDLAELEEDFEDCFSLETGVSESSDSDSSSSETCLTSLELMTLSSPQAVRANNESGKASKIPPKKGYVIKPLAKNLLEQFIIFLYNNQ